jgi:hypothetical protein
MAKLKITRTTGEIQEFEITPTIEYAFEQNKKKGIHKSFAEDSMQSDVYWLCWEAIRRSGETVPVFGEKFLDTLKAVEVLDSDPLED